MTGVVQLYLMGALTMASLVIGLRFLKYYRLSRDRFFVFFTAAFWTFGLGWAIRAFDFNLPEHAYVVYLPRLAGFLLILVAIFDKNRRAAT